jgi:AmmeMemoRadiSam system protein B/AmmeMemoRadiSam system protein A
MMNRFAQSMSNACVCAVAALLASILAIDACAGETGETEQAQSRDSGKIRPPAVAGSFYTDDPDELAQTVDELLAGVEGRKVSGRLVALVSPHAGYVYSGHVAAESYALLRGREIDRVVVISPSHVESFRGAAVYDGDGYATPLGVVAVDTEFAARMAEASPAIALSGNGHDHARGARGEHALEIQLPFLQRVLGDDFQLVPVVMGDRKYETCRALGVALADLIGDDDATIVVASSDLSHFHDYDEAVRLDKQVLSSIESWDYYSLSRNFGTRTWEACGGGPIVAAMMASERLGADRATLLKYANSGDVPAGDRDRVVGYSAFAITAGVDSADGTGLDLALTPREKEKLLALARRSVEAAVHDGKLAEFDQVETGPLSDPLGAFVTLNKEGQLRGCIGYVVPMKPLQETVRDVAAYAAIRDRRFVPVSEEELSQLEYEVSVLSPLRRMTDMAQIEVGTHGLLIKQRDFEGLLLPQVAAERGWDRVTFLRQTCQKAGLPPDAWKDPESDVFMFSALVFGEH